MEYQSTVTLESKEFPGVRYRIARMSFGRRLELTRQVRELSRRFEFLQAAADPAGRIEAGLIGGEVGRLYLNWGLMAVEGLEIDGEAAGVAGLVEAGPESLCQEILAAIKSECGLNEEERKN